MSRTDHGVTQYRGGLAQLVLGHSAVEQDGLEQAGVVQVNVIVPFLQAQKHTVNPLDCNYSRNQEHHSPTGTSVNNDCCVRLPSYSIGLLKSSQRAVEGIRNELREG